ALSPNDVRDGFPQSSCPPRTGGGCDPSYPPPPESSETSDHRVQHPDVSQRAAADKNPAAQTPAVVAAVDKDAADRAPLSGLCTARPSRNNVRGVRITREFNSRLHPGRLLQLVCRRRARGVI